MGGWGVTLSRLRSTKPLNPQPRISSRALALNPKPETLNPKPRILQGLHSSLQERDGFGAMSAAFSSRVLRGLPRPETENPELKFRV